MTRRALREYVTTYLDEVASLRYSNISSLQPPPFAGLARGAAGIPYLLWRCGESAAARRWLSALRADRRRQAYRYGDFAFPTSSFMYGRAGPHWVAALVDPARWTSTYVRAASRVTERNFMLGAAGYLTGARILVERRRHERLEHEAAAMADALLDHVRQTSRAPRDASGFAMRLPGLLHAILAWYAFDKREIPSWLVATLRALVGAWATGPEVVPPGFLTTWCNGAAGMVMLWTRAFASTSDERFLDAARRMAALAIPVDDPRSFLCCGLAGISYGLLSLARHDPEEDWRARAFEVGVRAVRIARRTPLEWPNSLYYGHPGIVCLAMDLLEEQPRGFPAIES